MTIEEKRAAVEARTFHGTSHLRYGKRMCGPDCLACNALTAYGLAVLDEADNGNAAAACEERCIHSTDDPEGCPVNQLAALRVRINHV